MANVSLVLSSGRDQRERERERERHREREQEIHEQNSRMPPMTHIRPSSKNAPSIMGFLSILGYHAPQL